MCSTKIASISNSCYWGSIGVPSAIVGAMVLMSSCSDEDSSSTLLLVSLLAVTSDSLGAMRLGNTLVCVVRNGNTWGSAVRGPGRF